MRTANRRNEAMRILRRLVAIIVVVGVLAVATRLAMPFAARRLIHSDPLAHADVIVVLGSARLERTLEAGTLFREGWSRRILLLRPPDVASRGVLSQLHIHVPLWLDIQKDALAQMSVPASAISDSSHDLDTTRTEAEYVALYARTNRCKRIIVVTSPYHTGRARRFFRRFAGKSFEMIMRADRYEGIDPDQWWRRPVDRSDVVFEYLKILHAFGSP